MLLTVSTGICFPMRVSIFSYVRVTGNGATGLGYISTTSPQISPPANSFTNRAARFKAYRVSLGSTPRSKRKDESVFNPWRRAVLRTHVGLKQADSKKISVVSLVTPDFKPPNTPAIHIDSFSLHIIKSLEVNVRSTSSSVTNFSPSTAGFTMTFPPAIRFKSKQCSGCPVAWSI